MRRLILAIAVVSLLPAGVGGESRILRIRSNQRELNYQLFHLAKDLRQTRRMLADTIVHMNDPRFGQELIREMVPLRLKQIQKSLRFHGKVVTQARKFSERILRNDLKEQLDLREDFSREVCSPMVELLDSKSGDLAQTEKAMQKLLQALTDQESQAVVQKFNQLIKSIDDLVYASDPDGSNSVAHALDEIERQQRLLTMRLMRHHDSLLTGPLLGVLDE